MTRSRRRRQEWLDKTKQLEQEMNIPVAAKGKHFYRNGYDKRRARHNNQFLSEISREETAGGIIYRIADSGMLQILLVADHFGRWTIPKGHIEPGETAQETAIREIGEEAGLHELEPVCWLSKIHFRYRRENVLVLMSTQIYLFKAIGDTNDIKKEDWMRSIGWFDYPDAITRTAYKDIVKAMRMSYRRLVQRGAVKAYEQNKK